MYFKKLLCPEKVYGLMELDDLDLIKKILHLNLNVLQ
jgi:hypothetical protein